MDYQLCLENEHSILKFKSLQGCVRNYTMTFKHAVQDIHFISRCDEHDVGDLYFQLMEIFDDRSSLATFTAHVCYYDNERECCIHKSFESYAMELVYDDYMEFFQRHIGKIGMRMDSFESCSSNDVTLLGIDSLDIHLKVLNRLL